MTRRWFQPSWKVFVKLDHFSTNRGKTWKTKQRNIWGFTDMIWRKWPLPSPPKSWGSRHLHPSLPVSKLRFYLLKVWSSSLPAAYLGGGWIKPFEHIPNWIIIPKFWRETQENISKHLVTLHKKDNRPKKVGTTHPKTHTLFSKIRFTYITTGYKAMHIGIAWKVFLRFHMGSGVVPLRFLKHHLLS